MEKMTLVLDIDGTLCPIKREDQSYVDIRPYDNIVAKVRSYKEQGARIVLYTSRNMKTNQGNLGLINATTAKVLLSWLDRWEIPYDEIYYGKPWPGENGFYVDDRAIRPDELLHYTPVELQAICDEARERIHEGEGNEDL